MRVLITDLDNTLYDWVTFFAKAFDALVTELTLILDTDRQSLLSQFKSVHQRYGNTEVPWASLELPAVKNKFPNATNGEIAHFIDPAFKAFSATRKQHLRLYPDINDCLTIQKK